MQAVKYFVYLSLIFTLWSSCDKQSAIGNNNNGNQVGQGGSLARFTIVNQYLYTVDGRYLSVFDISNPHAPVYKNKLNIGWNIETIYPFKDKLFIASSTAMYIYNIQNPINPSFESMAQHITGCDPVAANDSIAFLTIHGGTRCGNNLNVLQVYSIKNIAQPELLTSINLKKPMGLGLKGNYLYVCDRGVGLRCYNVSNPSSPMQIQLVTAEDFVDVIPMDSVMMCMLSDGAAFMDISTPYNIKMLSVVK
jgi:Uncharacterized conserved protein